MIADLGGGVHRVTQRLPWALDHVHCYAIEDPHPGIVQDVADDIRGRIQDELVDMLAHRRSAWTG